MCECKQKIFRISLNLSNFFHDHRAMCKIFINKEMKYVSDLEKHISTIFSIDNFYLKSQNYYIPSTEDIRILHHDDNLFAIPNQPYNWSNGVVHASTSWKDIATPHIAKEISDEIKNNSYDAGIPKKRKKRNINVDEDKKNKYVKIDENKEKAEAINENCQLEYLLDIKNDTVPKNKKKKKQKKNKSDSSVKEKVLYFENQSNLDEFDDGAENGTSEIKISDQQINKEKEDRNIPINLTRTKENIPINLTRTKEPQDFRHKKLLVQKYNNEIISFDLPKNSNIVKSIVVSDASVKSADKFSKLENEQMELSDVHNEIKMKNLSRINHSTPIHSVVENIPSNSCENSRSTPGNTSVVKNNEDDSPKKIEQLITCAENGENKNYLTDTNVKVEADKSINSNEQIVENLTNDEKETLINDKLKNNVDVSMDISLEKSVAYISNDKVNSSSNLQIESDFNSTNVSLVSEPSLYEVKSCSSTYSESVSNSCVETASFITKRKRKRSHKKRKSKTSSINSNATPTYIREKTSLPSVPPAVHIKYDEDGEPLPNNNQINEEEPHKNLMGFWKEAADALRSMEERLKNDLEKSRLIVNNNNKCDQSQKQNDSNLTTNSEGAEIDKLSSGAALISEDTILKSPLMTSTKPKIGDFIAFQTLRLTDNYTPEISKHILGEILYISENGPDVDVDIRIIDGIDQCKEPGGKFSVEDKSNELEEIRSYPWNKLIMPRLIFP